MPGGFLGAGLLAVVVVVLVVVAVRPGLYDPAEGVSRAPDMLPPAIAVLPEIVARRALGRAAGRLAGGLRLAASHPRWAITLAWLGATLFVLAAAR